MEEKSKVVEMNAQKETGDVKDQKLTYEQLEQVAGNLNKQCQELYTRLRNAQNTIATFSELGMLLDILGKKDCFGDAFISRCVSKTESIVNGILDAGEKKEEPEVK